MTSGTSAGPGARTNDHVALPAPPYDIPQTANADDQMTSQGGATNYAYDGDGSPSTYGGTALAFDPESRLTSYGTALTAGYDGDGLRGWKQGGAGRTYFLYDGATPLAEVKQFGGGDGAGHLRGGRPGVASHVVGQRVLHVRPARVRGRSVCPPPGRWRPRTS